MTLKDVIKPGVELNRSDIVEVLKGYSTFFEIEKDVKSLKLTDERIEEIANLFLGAENWKELEFASILYSKIKKYSQAAECAYASFYANGTNKQDIFELYTNSLINIFNNHLKNSNYEDAEAELKKIEDFVEINEHLDGMRVFNNALPGLQMRLEDCKIFASKVKKAEDAIEKQQWRIIEIVGIFSSIIALILGSVGIVTKLATVNESLVLMSGLAIVLIIFSLSISIIFGAKTENRESKIAFLIILIFCLLVLLKI